MLKGNLFVAKNVGMVFSSVRTYHYPTLLSYIGEGEVFFVLDEFAPESDWFWCLSRLGVLFAREDYIFELSEPYVVDQHI